MGTVISNIKYRFTTASMPLKFIYINIAVFLVLRIAGIVCYFAGIDIMSFLSFIELPASFSRLLLTPWTLLTYMFAHYDIMHILFNMLVLYWFGYLFLELFTPKQFCALYIIGGVGGALLFMLSFSVLPTVSAGSGWLIGASASIMAIVLATALKAPDYKLNLLLFGPVALKWIAGCYILFDLLSINGDNMGGHIAHIGGALTGILFTMLIKRGIDITNPLNSLIDRISNMSSLFNRKKFRKSDFKAKRPNSTTTSGSMSVEDEHELDIILDKIKKSGYSSLTTAEKNRLFQVSNRKQ